jgi:hypothetical protein
MSALGSPSLLLAVQQYQEAYDQAIDLFSVFEDADEQELLKMTGALAERCQELLSVAGLEWENCGNLGRHLTFLEYYLKRDDKESCAQDIRDILFFDMPTALKGLIAKSTDQRHIDQRLKDAVMPLVQGRHYDSAIRKSFVVLTDRLRRAFGVSSQLDGEDLVNLVFGSGGKIPVALDSSKKQAFRNLVSGFYGVYRNRYAHNDVEPGIAEVGAIVEMANSILLEIEAISSDSAKKA